LYVREELHDVGSAADWDDFLIMGSNLCSKLEKGGKWRVHQLWESGTDGECFEQCKIPREFEEYYKINLST
jgi:hypothetical protein